MLLAQIHVPQGTLTLEQRRAIMKGGTGLVALVKELPATALPHVTVIINGASDSRWGAAVP